MCYFHRYHRAESRLDTLTHTLDANAVLKQGGTICDEA